MTTADCYDSDGDNGEDGKTMVFYIQQVPKSISTKAVLKLNCLGFRKIYVTFHFYLYKIKLLMCTLD